jgi:acylphosphatase
LPGLTGTARVGADSALQKLEERLNEGPSFAHVSRVEREAIAERGASGFHVR